MSTFLYTGYRRSKCFCFKLFVLLMAVALFGNTVHYIYLCKTITLEEVAKFLVPAPRYNLKSVRGVKLCELWPTFEDSVLPYPNYNVTEDNLKELEVRLRISEGGAWKPSDCLSQHRVAVVVPYRDRLSNLQVFLYHMHPILQAQQLDYQIFIVEQTNQRPFNRAKLFNVGFVEIEKLSTFHCFIFHDVDLIPENLNNIYACTSLPRHMSAYIDKNHFQLPYVRYFGGVVAILKSHFQNVNGFSNNFFGWGGEDDDFFNRVIGYFRRICRFEYRLSKYFMLSHKKQEPSEDRYSLLQAGEDRYKTDGLNSLKYSDVSLDKMPLYTRILADL